jgi:hypothetical protein
VLDAVVEKLKFGATPMVFEMHTHVVVDERIVSQVNRLADAEGVVQITEIHAVTAGAEEGVRVEVGLRAIVELDRDLITLEDAANHVRRDFGVPHVNADRPR